MSPDSELLFGGMYSIVSKYRGEGRGQTRVWVKAEEMGQRTFLLASRAHKLQMGRTHGGIRLITRNATTFKSVASACDVFRRGFQRKLISCTDKASLLKPIKKENSRRISHKMWHP